MQSAMFCNAETDNPVPLLVDLHTWGELCAELRSLRQMVREKQMGFYSS